MQTEENTCEQSIKQQCITCYALGWVNSFKIYKYPNNKIQPAHLTAPTPNEEKNFPITINAFYDKLFHHKLEYISKIIKCFICFDMNVNRTYKYLTEKKNINISKRTIRRVYHEIRKIISKL